MKFKFENTTFLKQPWQQFYLVPIPKYPPTALLAGHYHPVARAQTHIRRLQRCREFDGCWIISGYLKGQLYYYLKGQHHGYLKKQHFDCLKGLHLGCLKCQSGWVFVLVVVGMTIGLQKKVMVILFQVTKLSSINNNHSI